MEHREVTLNDKYDLVEGHAYMTGIQALVRLPLDQRRLDRAAGYNTAGFISGYRGSPLGGYDQQLRAAQKWLDAHDIEFWEGLNEDLGATAVWGSQQLGLFPGARRDGLFGIWYGKAPGVDRSGDAFKHANAAGSSRLGGVLAICGDDHMCKSSTLPSQSEYAMRDAEIPVLNPASIQDVLDYGIHGWAMSRFSGAWSALIALADTMDSGAVVDVALDRLKLIKPDFEFPEDGVHMRRGDNPLDKERRLRQFKLPAAQAWVKANGLDHVLIPSPKPRVGIVTTGQAARDIFEALAAIGLTPEQAGALGISVFKVAMPWPLEQSAIREFCRGLERVLVIEHKRPLIEEQLRAALYSLPDNQRPYIEGKRDKEGKPLLSEVGSIPVPEIADAVMHRVPGEWDHSAADQYFTRVGAAGRAALSNASPTVRSPHYCSGCPHNTSTVVPEGSRALAGIGCHYMANFMPDRNTDMTSQMGGEGIAWLGQYFATDEDHMFVNLGDGTYSHSGSLAIRAAVSSKANMTYKILYNDAVAMTGGQHVESGQTPVNIAQQVEAEGVTKIVIVTEDPTRYAGVKGLPRSVRIYDREKLDEVQRMLRDTPGVSVLIYDQICATEKRRRSKRGLRKPDRVRVMINQEVCEGCGDCSVKSNCLSVEPVETDLGRKRRINQSTCNTDLSCLRGFCPSFVTIKDGHFAAEDEPGLDVDASGLPLPDLPSVAKPWNVLFTGVGGTGVTTVAAVLAMAAHVDGNASSSLDMTGLAQKGGPVLSHLRFAKHPELISTGRVPPASADAVIACDLVVAASGDALGLMDVGRTVASANADVTPTSEFIRDRSKKFESQLLAARVKRQARDFGTIDAEALALLYLNDAIYTNMIMVGYAWQKGHLPVSLRGLYRAIKLNGVKVEENMKAFDVGRLAAADPERLAETPDPRGEVKPMTLDELIEDRASRLVAYQNDAYAQQYRDLVAEVRAKEEKAGLGEGFTTAVAKFAFKLMAYKDEYEVARLFTDGSFDKKLRETFKGGKIQFHMAPPLLSKKDANGHLLKKKFGPWMKTAFSLMKRFKGLRGTRFDPFGYTAERKMERQLRDDYLENMVKLADGLTKKNHELAIAIASIPDDIRGYGHVKEAAVEAAEARSKELWQNWPEGGMPKEKKTLIAAE
ncbi:indolepyruvate ferredoxin oxidoreductase family protein [Henriciella mobilis]|uniref:Indolepyruvate ferredoxin oxidoreductase family protein n=1 Tax=Henriciella mobilis TaxID=2305467 RepID=A0A399RRF6_9PROT|nr:indolepyruvate ferredoxin oxidoreductase family protein [Henriciella mobilis]RIJ32487.1 indolepyruvate ferredoxin oxidoreductase family protein [Henriciella mobilis]